jgi:AcrR family transcriptional regulator
MADTRQAILDAARTCLLRSGFSNLSTRAVAEEAGVGTGHLHYHFGSKRNLVLAVLDAENAASARAPGADVRIGGPRCGSSGSRPATSSRTT